MRKGLSLPFILAGLAGVGAVVAAVLARPPEPTPAPSNVCRPPASFRNTPPPAALPLDRLITQEETVVIDAPRAVVLAMARSTELADTIQAGGSLPHVTGVHMLTPGEFEGAGARRLTCLSDGSTLVEQILERREDTDPAEFRYVVWNYTSDAAAAVDYAVGRFRHLQRPDGRTEVRWTYGFRLRRDRLPGALGPLGGFLFRKVFLERDYAEMMRATLVGTKSQVEGRTADP